MLVEATPLRRRQAHALLAEEPYCPLIPIGSSAIIFRYCVIYLCVVKLQTAGLVLSFPCHFHKLFRLVVLVASSSGRNEESCCLEESWSRSSLSRLQNPENCSNICKITQNSAKVEFGAVQKCATLVEAAAANEFYTFLLNV